MVNPDYHNKVYEYINPDILSILKYTFTSSNKKILDVGCGTGALGEALKKKGNIVYGIDISKKSIEIAKKRLDKVVQIDLETENKLPFKEASFDLIIFGDVLEHFRDPLSVLKNIRKYLKKDGIIIISLPNIANWEIRLKLLFGKFNYQKEGILDDTHVRFFTLKTAKELIKKAGLRIIKIEARPGAPVPARIFPKLKYALSQVWKTLFAKGFVFIAEIK